MKYCCEEFKDITKQGAVTDWSNIYPTRKMKLNLHCYNCGNNHTEYFEIAYCPFCGKKLGEE